MNRIGQGPIIRIERTVFPLRISAMEYAELVAQIPEGYLSTTKLLEKKLCLKYGAQAVEFEGPTPHFIDKDTGKVSLYPPERYDLIPYHRVLYMDNNRLSSCSCISSLEGILPIKGFGIRCPVAVISSF